MSKIGYVERRKRDCSALCYLHEICCARCANDSLQTSDSDGDFRLVCEEVGQDATLRTSANR